ncbi:MULTISPECIES: DUF4105 domain-containing protein [Bartonella]|uniref:Lnb N-terminal periplasmic domain-containing protein n=1 Tax=Bartonella TaxID=773 RepID=UPI0018DE14DA|nr:MULTISPECIES: DUF4105 domain-containing protein [Bartonella]MBH9975974.1 DUF4105 domain-containing protein [Bartonella choladocola]MBI0015685.1 DUF4105 domain-containing protein [Bartonella sp. B10834G3]MBI0141324.1 DUF4105 domain-containing protein [Bartonella choladocola]
MQQSLSVNRTKFTRIIARIVTQVARAIWFVFACFMLLWSLFAFFYQLPFNMPVFVTIAVLWLVIGIYALALEFRTPWKSRIILAIMFIAVTSWWATIKPTLHRDWAPELSKSVEAEFDPINPDIVHLENIRDFDWISAYEGKERWENGTYNIKDIVGLDVYLSYWMGPYIAHTLVGFTFKDGRHLVFSAEIRRTKDQSFSAIGGFFKEFELIMIAAPEEDIIKLRTDIRGEHVYRYPINVDREKIEELFLNYLETANKLARKARFYNTVTANCTTVVFDMARILDPGIPLDWRILFSGQLPSYLYDLKVVDTKKSLATLVDEARIVPQINGRRDQYSVDIRRARNTNGN